MKLLLSISLIGFCLAVHTNAQDSRPFDETILTYLSDQDAQALYYSVKNIQSDHLSTLDDVQKEKVNQLEDMLGSRVPVGNRPSNISVADYMDQRKSELKDRYADRSVLLDDMTRVASAFSNEEGKTAAAHILDLVITIDPTKVAAAYEREKLFIEDKVQLGWQGKIASTNNTEDSKPPKRDDIMRSQGGDVYEIDFSKLGVGGTGGRALEGLAKNQALIKGLLVQELSGSQFAGEASQMNATVLGKDDSSDTMVVSFNQKVGSMMTDAVDKMMAFLEKRHGSLPAGIEVELSFEEQYIPKDGPSAGVACTLMIDSLLKGHEFASDFAVTGALDKDGKVGGVGGIDGKIRGAISRNCELVAIPSENERVIQDMLILEGPATLAKIQILEIETYDQALQIAKSHESRSADVKKAVETFREVQQVVARPGGQNYLRNMKVQGKLREVLKILPNHLSAKYLLLKGMGREGTSLTLLGSVQAIDRNAAPLINALREGDFDVQDRLGKDSFADTISAMTRLRPMLDQRTRPCADAIVKFSGYIRVAINNPPRSQGAIIELSNNIKTSGRAVGNEYDNLFSRADVKDELMIGDDDE